MDAGLDTACEAALDALTATSAARETALACSRRATRASANAIRALHRGDRDDAAELMATARGLLDDAVAALGDYPQIRWAGFVHDAQKEYAEAALTASAVTGAPAPSAAEVGVTDVAWLHGLAESVGELRRESLDRLRGGDLAGAQALLVTMDDYYAVLVRIDFPDAMTAGLRRATDAVRGVLERTRADLTIATVQDRLERALAGYSEKTLGASSYGPVDDAP